MPVRQYVIPKGFKTFKQLSEKVKRVNKVALRMQAYTGIGFFTNTQKVIVPSIDELNTMVKRKALPKDCVVKCKMQNRQSGFGHYVYLIPDHMVNRIIKNERKLVPVSAAVKNLGIPKTTFMGHNVGQVAIGKRWFVPKSKIKRIKNRGLNAFPKADQRDFLMPPKRAPIKGWVTVRQIRTEMNLNPDIFYKQASKYRKKNKTDPEWVKRDPGTGQRLFKLSYVYGYPRSVDRIRETVYKIRTDQRVPNAFSGMTEEELATEMEKFTYPRKEGE